MNGSVLRSGLSRRSFLKSMGLIAGVLAALPIIPKNGYTQILASTGRIFRGTRDGKIQISSDLGKSWNLWSSFGNKFDVREIVDTGELVYAKIGFQNLDIALRSSDGVTWYTAGYKHPAL